MKSLTLIRTSSTIPLGTFKDRSASYKVILVGFNSSSPNCSYTKYDNMLTLTPRSSRALIMRVFPIMHEIVGDLGTLYFIGIWSDKYELTLAARKALLGTLVVFFLVHKSLKNLA